MNSSYRASVAQHEIEDYNREKAEIHEKLQQIHQLAEQGDPAFQEQLAELIGQTSKIQNIHKTNSI